MNKETIAMILIVFGSVLALVLFTKSKQVREMAFAFLVAQSFSWPITIGITYAHALECPVRLFPKATDSCFITAYVFNPTVFALYYTYYPRNTSVGRQMAYTCIINGSATLVHVITQRYTDLMKYITFSGYWTLLFFLITFYVSRRYCDWYFGRLSKKPEVPNS